MQAAEHKLQPIGVVTSERDQPVDDNWDAIRSYITLDRSQFGSAALAGLDTFSHIEVLYLLNRVTNEKIVFDARHPRGQTSWPKVGIFAQRAKNRPNRIASTICRLQHIDNVTIYLQGLDAINGSPVLDIKPVMQDFLPRGQVTEPAWAGQLMRHYW